MPAPAPYVAPLLEAINQLGQDWRAAGDAARGRYRGAAGRAAPAGQDFGTLIKAISATTEQFAADAKETLAAGRKIEFAKKFAVADAALKEAISAGRVSAVDAAKAEGAMARLAEAAAL